MRQQNSAMRFQGHQHIQKLHVTFSGELSHLEMLCESLFQHIFYKVTVLDLDHIEGQSNH